MAEARRPSDTEAVNAYGDDMRLPYGRAIVLEDPRTRWCSPELGIRKVDRAPAGDGADASGAVVHLFPTGQGNIIGNPIEPVIKISGNPLTCSTMGEHIDHNVSAILRGEMTVDEAGDELIDMIVRTANGRLTAAEALGHREFVLTKLYRSA